MISKGNDDGRGERMVVVGCGSLCEDRKEVKSVREAEEEVQQQ